MATSRLTLTLPGEQLAEIRALVEAGRSPSVSAFVKHAVDVSLSDAAGWKDMLDDALRQTGGPLTKRERNWVDSLIAPPTPKPHKSSRNPSAAPHPHPSQTSSR